MVPEQELPGTQEYVGVRTLAPSQLRPNPHNPRLLFDTLPLETLERSIKKSGVLVPLTVYHEPSDDTWVILDGQRRWLCAVNLGLESVPVNQVHRPSLVENIVTMFQIHKLREDWELMPTALTVEILMRETEERGERALAEITGLDKAVVVRCKKLLDYANTYRDMMIDPDPEKRMKADFFIELHAVRNDRFVNSLDWYSRSAFTEAMLDKYLNGQPGLKAVTDFRIVKQHITNARRAGKEKEISQRLRRFQKERDLSPDVLLLDEADVHAFALRTQKAADKLEAELADLDPAEYFGEGALWLSLERLADRIDVMRRRAGFRPRA